MHGNLPGGGWPFVGLVGLLVILGVVFHRRKLAFAAFLSVVLLAVTATLFVMSYWGNGDCYASTKFATFAPLDTWSPWASWGQGGFGFRLMRGHVNRVVPGLPPPRDYLAWTARFTRGTPVYPSHPPNVPPLHHYLVDYAGFTIAYADHRTATPAGGVTLTFAFDGMVTMPGWFVLAMLSACPIAWLIRRRHHRFPAGRCQRCGYDLRATPANGKCQECGTPVPAGHRPSVGAAPTPPTAPAAH